MAATPQPVAKRIQTIDPEAGDFRVLGKEEARVLAWFFLYGENVFSQYGLSWQGASFRQRGVTCNLAVKAGQGDTQLVAFTTGRTPIDCVRIFCRKWHAGTVEWYPDKYR